MRSSVSMMRAETAFYHGYGAQEQPSACELGTAQQGVGGAGNHLLQDRSYLPSSGSDVLMQGAFSLESIHGARTGYVVLDFTRENFDNLLNGFYSSGDTLLVLDSHPEAPLLFQAGIRGT